MGMGRSVECPERGYPAPLRLPMACAGYRDRGIRHGLPRADLRGRGRPDRSGLAKRITNLDGRCDDRTRILARLGGIASGAAWRGYFPDRKSTRLNSSHVEISYAVFCLKKKKKK